MALPSEMLPSISSTVLGIEAVSALIVTIPESVTLLSEAASAMFRTLSPLAVVMASVMDTCGGVVSAGAAAAPATAVAVPVASSVP